MSRMPVIFFGHGSPTNALEDNRFTRSWAQIASELPERPQAILCVSAHWCTRGTAVTAMKNPRTLHDFGGFPALNKVQYPAPGSPALAEKIAGLLDRKVGQDKSWGLDHGCWSVLVHAFPEADIPVLQLSMDIALSSKQRFDIGRQLAALRDEGVLIIASGNIVHNLGTMDWNIKSEPYPWCSDFNNYIIKALQDDEADKILAAESFGQITGRCHPTPDHFWPLHYFLGTRQADDNLKIYTPQVMHKSLSMASFVFNPPS
ncbi:MAG: 4,5-DOPA dioxygenase extradiol [Oceanospirillaceae bacterium]|nr:4,5-DOPA dioxygenase extradiol [Oceanospirillaceae bacterium]MBT13068.1 4,5-DOPA dioxygenase extradiol [Oceanospirillaceae bacterium]